MKKSRLLIYILLIVFCFSSTFRIVELSVFKKDHYIEKYENLKNVYVSGPSAPRGRILDRNGKVLVDNRGSNTIIYNRTNGSSEKQEVDIAYKLGELFQYEEKDFSLQKMKTFYLILHDNGKNLITQEEYKMLEERRLDKKDIEALKYERVTNDMIEQMSYEDKNAGYIYHILSKGYFYEDKMIKKDLTDEEVVKISDLELPGVRVELIWERIYPYGDVLKTVFGTISSSVPIEYKDYYKDKGVDVNSTVGVSFLEFQYDEYLRGENSLYKLESGHLEKVKEEKQGCDLYLSIDIETQLKVEEVLKAEMLSAKKAPNTEYFNHSYVIVGEPQTGAIVAASGLQLNKDHFVDITANMINSSYTVGSVVKGATISVGYQNGLIKEGQKVLDSCIKVYGVSKKCSWTSLGYVDDVRALAQSSNYYQFLIAAKLANPKFSNNKKLNATKEHFDIYRNMLESYGLGAKTGIDLPNEQLGIKGKTASDDLLLNLAIGQYDTYTPIEVFQYINTIANDGVRLSPSLMLRIERDGEVIVEREKEELNHVLLEDNYLKRVQKGLREVMISGTGRNYIDINISAAGKTGTSETFVDTNGDGKIDTRTISTAFIMYAPFENPQYSVVSLSPNISRSDGSSSYKYALNLRVNRKIVNYLFEKS